MGGDRISNKKYIEYINKMKLELNEYKEKITLEELDIFNDTIDKYLMWNNIQLLYGRGRKPFSAVMMFFTPPKKDEKDETKEI